MAKGRMHAALSRALVVVLITSAVPVTAQDQSFGPLTRAAIREAVKIAAAEPAPSDIGTVHQGGTSTAFDWSRVRQLEPRTELIVTSKHAGTVRGYFVAADASELVVSHGRVEHVARIDVAEVRMLKRRDFYGVANSASFKWGVVVGIAAGLTTAGLTLHSYCKTNTCDTAPAVAIAGYTMLGFLIGGGIGALVAVGSKMETVIYRAP